MITRLFALLVYCKRDIDTVETGKCYKGLKTAELSGGAEQEEDFSNSFREGKTAGIPAQGVLLKKKKSLPHPSSPTPLSPLPVKAPPVTTGQARPLIPSTLSLFPNKWLRAPQDPLSPPWWFWGT